MIKRSSILVGFLFSASIICAQKSPIPKGPWKQLFGKDMLKPGSGWSFSGFPPWSMEGDSILNAKGGTVKTFMVWNEPIKNMDFEITYKLSSSAANGGFQIRSVCSDKSKTAPTCGGTYSICGLQLDVAEAYSGQLFEECFSFLANTGQNIDNCRKTLKVGQWMTTTAIINENQASIWLNGVWCLDYTLTKVDNLQGTIFALQSHGPFDLIQYKSIKIRRPGIKGCMTLTDPKYNPEASIDSGCTPSGMRTKVAALEKKPFLKVNHGELYYSLPGSGMYTIRLVDVFGAVAKQFTGAGSVDNAKLPLPSSGIFFFELEYQGTISRHRVLNF
jgi:hypothetical protein